MVYGIVTRVPKKRDVQKPADRKPLDWIGDSLEVISSFPDFVRSKLGYALDQEKKRGVAL
jgi:phage-related protein